MTRWLPAVVILAVLTALSTAAVTGRAGGPNADTPEQRARRFEQNRPLVEALVRGGLKLASKPDPLERAACCNGVAVELAEEMGRAVEARNTFRAAELGTHLSALLEDGVAANLGAAVDSTPRGSQREKLFWVVRDRSADALRPLEDLLDGSLGTRRGPADPRQKELIRALEAVRAGRLRIDEALHSRGLREPARAE